MVASYPKKISHFNVESERQCDGIGPLGLSRWHDEQDIARIMEPYRGTQVSKTKLKWMRFCDTFHNIYDWFGGIFYWIQNLLIKVLPFLAILSMESAIYAWAPIKQNALIVLVMTNILGLLVMIGHKLRSH